MGAITRISWCDATFNPWVGCLRVSTACDRCYAAGLSWRYGWRDGKGRDLWDVTADRKRTSSAYWRGPLRWSERAQAQLQAGTESLRTRRWREMDSNHWSRGKTNAGRRTPITGFGRLLREH